MGKQSEEKKLLIDKEETNGRTDGHLPYDTAGIFSSLFFVWLFRFVVKAFKQEMTEDDLYKTGRDMTVKANTEAFEKSWNTLSEKTKGKKNKLFWHLLWHFRRPIGKLYIVAVLWYTTVPSLIILMRLLMLQLERGGDLAVVLPIILIITVCGFFSVFLNNQAGWFARIVETRVKIILSSMIFKKMLSMSSCDRRKTTSGHIISLISSDLERINSTLLGATLILSPVMLFILIEGFIVVGVALIPSLALGLVSIALQLYFMIKVAKICVRRNQETDRRVGLMNEIIRSIRLIKMYCWEKPFSKKAQQLRRKEMSSQLQFTLLSAVSVGFYTPVTRLTILLVVITQVLRGQPILHQTTVGMIGLLRIACTTLFLYVPLFLMKLHQLLPSIERIKDFLMTPNIIEKCITTGEPRVELSNLTGSWDDEEERDRCDFMLNKITLSVTKKQLYGIVGKVGAGKSTVLRACLDELYIHSGSCSVRGSVAYVPQEPWIISESVRDNILMGEPYDRVKYYSVIKGCCLEEDLRQVPHGDLTMIGERGLTLSGGQKARIALARAVYQNADVYLLDDPLSAVDGQVAKALFHNCICGLLRDKVRLLVTHQLRFLPLMDQILLLHKGEEVCHGPYPDIEDTIHTYVKEDTAAQGTEGDNPVLTSIIEEEEQVEPETSYIKFDNTPGPGKSKDKNETGTISSSVYLKYVQAGKGIYLIPLLLVVSTLGMLAGVLFDWNIASWDSRRVSSTLLDLQNKTKAMDNPDESWSILNTELQGDSWHLKYFGVTLCINAFGSMTGTLVVLCMLVIASYRLYNAMFYRVLKAPVWFFDINPLGQVLNRFARDTSFMDIEMLYPIISILNAMFVTIPDVLFVCFIDYTSLIPLTCAVATFYIILKLVMPSVTSTKRLEASLRSATFSHISTTLDGLSVIRAMRKEEMFITDAHSYIDKQTSAWFLFIATQRVMAFYIAFACAMTLPCIVLILTFGFTEGGVASSQGLALVYLVNTLDNIQLSLRCFSDLETNMTGVERIQQYSKLEQEAPDHEELRPPTEWPLRGRIEFNDMVLTYKDQPKPALGPLTLTIQAGEKVGVIGRTGAGKSSLLVGLMRMVEPSGSIHIDGINTQTIGLADLRSAMAVIPQDPVTFSGTFRYNLDPFTKYSDAELWSVLEKVQMMEKLKELPSGLYTEMTEGGNNVSIGEKQLLCLARAMLKKSKVILVDEATANIDNRTDSIIQQMMHTHLADATVITIAHRLNTLTAADKILVLDHGKLVQYGAAQDLLTDTSGAFYQLLAVHGDSCIQAFKQH